MEITLRRFTLTKRYPLTISRGTVSSSENLLVEIRSEGVAGLGEMSPVAIGGEPETVETALADFERWESGLADLSPWDFQRIEAALDASGGGRAARAALDIALHDWLGKRLGVPLWKLLGLDRRAIPPISVTIGINPPEVIRERTPEILHRTGARALKVKLGSPEGLDADRAIFSAVQEAAGAADQAPLWRVDANGGWSVDGAREMIPWLAERGVEFVEQPLPKGQERDLPEARASSPLPLYADESVCVAADVPPLADRVDGVNLKLMKCGGIREAIRIVHAARAHGLKVMMGCFSESSLAITAAAQISSLADSLDLDSHLNLLPDPFAGAALLEGRVLPNDEPGLGVRRSLEE
jgi:L-alanine-DL-glutamate epimerase-like enolase superfamily enzyme